MAEARVYDLWSGPRSKGLPMPPGDRWQVRWEESDPATGKVRRPGRKFPTEAKANLFAKEVNKKLDAGTRAPSTDGKKTFREVALHWQATRVGVRQSHRDRGERELRTWVLPRLGNRQVGSIRRAEVQELASDLLNGAAMAFYSTGLAPTTVRSIVGQIRQVMAHAIDSDWMSTVNPVSNIKVGKIEKTRTNYLTFEEIDRLLALVEALPRGEQHAVVVHVMTYGGLRIGEALALKASDVRLAERRIIVQRSWTTARTVWSPEGATKTGRTRSVPISADLMHRLKPYVERAGRDGWLFVGRRGIGPEQPDNWRSRVWVRAVSGTEFDTMGLRPHDLRHTAASMAIAAGVEVVAVQQMLGHATATETLDTYAHLWPDRLDAIPAAVAAFRKTREGLSS